MDEKTALDPLWCHFGGPSERFMSLIARRRHLYDLPILEMSRETLHTVFQGAIDVDGCVAVAMLGPGERLAFQSAGADESSLRLPARSARACGETLPEVVAYELAASMGELPWALQPIAVLSAVNGPNVLLFACLSVEFLPPVYQLAVHDLPGRFPALAELAPLLTAAASFLPNRPPEAELREPLRRPIRRWLHQNLVKPFLRSRRKLASKVLHACRDASTVIDVSAGDDTIALELAQAGLELVVANDIAFPSMQHMGRARAGRVPANLVLMSRQVEHLAFERRFDVALLKNTLHHFTSAKEVSASLAALRSVAKRLIFIEIEDPARSMLGRLWNAYYERLLGDGEDQHRFFDGHVFRQVVRRHFDGANIVFDVIATGRGNYLTATVDL